MLAVLLLETGAVRVAAAPVASGQTLSAVDCGPDYPDGLIVYTTPVGDPSGPRTEVVVVSPDGVERRRVELAGHAVLRPLGVGCFVLANVEGGRPFLFDAATGTLRELDLPRSMSGEVSPQLRAAPPPDAQRRWAILYGGGLGAEAAAALLDTQTGSLVDLGALVSTLPGDAQAAPQRFGPSGLFSPDESHLLFTIGVGSWLLPTADPASGRRLATTAPAEAAQFSDDGRRIVSAGVFPTEGIVRVVEETIEGAVVGSEDFSVEASASAAASGAAWTYTRRLVTCSASGCGSLPAW